MKTTQKNANFRQNCPFKQIAHKYKTYQKHIPTVLENPLSLDMNTERTGPKQKKTKINRITTTFRLAIRKY